MALASDFISVNGTRIHYLSSRSPGPPVLVIHGSSHCAGLYTPLVERLASDFNVLALDQRGHGLSEKPESYTWTELRADVVAFTEALDLHDLVLVGHSRGGGVCLLTAAALPDRVRAIIGYEPTFPLRSGPPPPEGWSSRFVRRALNRRATFATREEMYKHFHGRGAFAGWREDYLRAFVEYGAVERDAGGVELACPPQVEAMLHEALPDLTEWQDLQRCEVPLLCVLGGRGGRVGEGRDPTAMIRTVFSNCEPVVLAEGTHMGPMEYPDAFEGLIREFVGRLPQVRASLLPGVQVRKAARG